MKQAKLNKSWIYNSNGEMIGINLGFEYAAEHEFGISGISSIFGLYDKQKKSFIQKLFSKKQLGLEKRKMTELPKMFTKRSFRKNVNYYAIGCCLQERSFDHLLEQSIQKLEKSSNPEKTEFISFWDEDGFFLVHTNEEYNDRLLSFFKNKDVCFYVGLKGFLSTGGLSLASYANTDQEVKDLILQADLDSERLKKMSKKTRMQERLEKAGRSVHSIKPGWNDDEKTAIWFWVNPVSDPSGWYTIEELERWIETGILKTIDNKHV